MGKLSKIKKEIVKDPKRFMFAGRYPDGAVVYTYRKKGKERRVYSQSFSRSHKNFVTKVLKELGHIK